MILDVLAHGAAILYEKHSIFLPIRIVALEYTEKLFQEVGILLHVRHYVHLVKEDQAVQDREGWIVEDAREDDVLQIKQAVCEMDFPSYVFAVELDDFFEFGRVGEVLAMVRAVRGEVGVVCDMISGVLGMQ